MTVCELVIIVCEVIHEVLVYVKNEIVIILIIFVNPINQLQVEMDL